MKRLENTMHCRLRILFLIVHIFHFIIAITWILDILTNKRQMQYNMYLGLGFYFFMIK